MTDNIQLIQLDHSRLGEISGGVDLVTLGWNLSLRAAKGLMEWSKMAMEFQSSLPSHLKK